MKKKDAYIIGSGGQARVIISMLRNNYAKIYRIKKIYSLNKKIYKNDLDLHVPIQRLEKISDIKKNKNCFYFIAIGEIIKRKKIFNQCINQNLNLPNLISNTSHIDSTVELGLGNIVLPLSHIGPFVKIGNNNVINTNANLEHEVVLGNHSNINPGAIICGRVKIDNAVLIGANSVVIENLKVKDGSIIGAGSVLKNSTRLQNRTYIGSPAKIVKKK